MVTKSGQTVEDTFVSPVLKAGGSFWVCGAPEPVLYIIREYNMRL
jgi:hypothetical protein